MSDTVHGPVIAVAGATGNLGSLLVETFLSGEIRFKTSDLILLPRRHTPKTRQWGTRGAQIRVIDDTDDIDGLVDALEDVDVLVNALSSAGRGLSDNLVQCLPRTSVRLYFPSEFGVDHTLHDFGVPEWDSKKAHFEVARNRCSGTEIQICRLFIGLSLHSGIGPWYGLHTSKGVYNIAGDPAQNVSYTDLGDVARVISILSRAMLTGQRIPQTLRIAGTHSSISETAKMMEAAGSEAIEVRSVELETFRAKALGRPYNERVIMVLLRLLMADGRVDYRTRAEGGLGNDNEVVNPGQKYFRWKKLKDLARETGGRPNAGAHALF